MSNYSIVEIQLNEIGKNPILARLTQKKVEELEYELITVPTKRYKLLQDCVIEEHQNKIVNKKLGLRVKDIKSFKVLDRTDILLLIASNKIKEYEYSFSIDKYCVSEILLCNLISDPSPKGIMTRPLYVVPDKLVKIALQRGYFAVGLSQHLESEKKRISLKWLKNHKE